MQLRCQTSKSVPRDSAENYSLNHQRQCNKNNGNSSVNFLAFRV